MEHEGWPNWEERQQEQEHQGITETLGKQVTGIVTPVSICMALTVCLVRILNPEGVSGSSAVAIATVYYSEEEDDTAGQKLAGSIINAIIFVAIVAAMTFVLFLLFKYRCYGVIYGYMGFAGFNIFFFLSGTLTLKLFQAFHLHLDAFTFVYVLYNFAVVGMLALFFMPVPITMKQGYLIITGIVVAYIFTLIPEWTTWVMLIAMALYDLCAVLLPGGPLKVLVELAMERNEELPALVFESRPIRPGQAPGQWRPRRRDPQQAVAEEIESNPPRQAGVQMVEMSNSRVSPQGSAARQRAGPVAEARNIQHPSIASSAGEDHVSHEAQAAPGSLQVSSNTDAAEGMSLLRDGGAPPVMTSTLNRSPTGAREQPLVLNTATVNPATIEDGMRDEDSDLGMPDSIKLGLGDFIFYSVLVGRASMYDLLTVFASYLAIIAGLGITLLCLAVFQRALPALPFSIVLGVTFYFLARLVLEPFLVPMVVNLVLF